LISEASDQLSAYFRVGAEMVTYRDGDDLAEKIRHFLNHPDERDAIAEAGHQRVQRDHLYESRFAPILERAFAMAGNRRNNPWALQPGSLQAHVENHRRGFALRRMLDTLRTTAGGPAHRRRVWRGLRRLTYEMSWRVCGERTFQAKGLPGRLFYRES
jgi:spore maturation protein CgeB